MKKDKLIIKESTTGLRNVLLISIICCLFLGFILISYTKELGEKIITSFLLLMTLISFIWNLTSLIRNKPKLILSYEGLWHKDLKGVIAWHDIGEYYYEVTINEGINFWRIVLGIKSKKKRIGLDVTLLGFSSIEELNKEIKSYCANNNVIYKGVIER